MTQSERDFLAAQPIGELHKRLALAKMLVNAAIEFGSLEKVVKEYMRQCEVIEQAIKDREGGVRPPTKPQGQVVALRSLNLRGKV